MLKFKALFALCIGTLSVSAAANNTITIEDIPKVKSVIQSQVSPSGDYVAFTRSIPRELYVDKNGRNYSNLFVTNAKGEERAFITGKVNLGSIAWSADGQFIYFLGKFDDDKFTKLYRIPFSGGERQVVIALKEKSVSRYQLSPNGKQVAILANPAKDKSEKQLKELGFMAEVYEENLKNKQLFFVDLVASDKAIDPKAVAIDAYVSDISWGKAQDTLLVKTQPTSLIDDQYMKSQWHVFNTASKKVALSIATEGKLGSAELSPDGKYIAIVGAEDKHDPATGRLFLVETKTGKLTDWLPNFMGHVGDIEWANKSNTLHFVANVGTQSYIATIKPGSSDIDVIVENGTFIASNLSVSNSDKTLVTKGHTAKHPNEVFMVRKGKETRVSNSNAWLANKRFAKQETVSFKAEDGTELDGVLVYPLDYKKGKRYPLIMSVHGGPEAHDKDGWVTAYSRPGQMGAARGYAVFYPNYRGSTGKGVAYSKLGQNDYAGEEFNDLVRFKNHLVEMGLVDSKRVGITGGSYGGYASAWGATKLTEHFAASVMFVGIANQTSKFGTTDISNEMHLVHARSYPWEKWQYYLERSPIYWVAQSKTPLLIMHGKDDPRVHPAQSMEMYRYMKVQGKDVRLVYYPGEGHGNRKVAAQYDYSLRLMRWMDNYLIAGKKAMPPYKIDHKANMDAKKKDSK
ncbi:S9 family peptidase [Thalassotalea agarivorans]|uniref:Dipeptidyl aminopeptidase/acylaminoacyl peptidase n=1 Tax=Thalassotalea agarivorans TaxID=349064 RepID=A0A1I0GHR8_THASX|nr:S9 family peptidase [Thalassotalea agarivorans]SET70707.1 Dipeptidyl aminopeptidase/acylaminoacyl peptidase [Thalassotalea agarivorans]